MDSLETREWDRVAFVASWDGISAVIDFVELALGQYESAIRDADSGGNQYGAAYREGLLASIRVYRQYLKQKKALEKVLSLNKRARPSSLQSGMLFVHLCNRNRCLQSAWLIMLPAFRNLGVLRFDRRDDQDWLFSLGKSLS